MFSRREKNGWALFLLLLAGIVIGGFIGDYVGKLEYMGWLKYGKQFGFDQPLSLAFEDFLRFQFAFTIKITISSILGIIAAILIYRRL